jgi:DNA mismatch repair protein MutL
VVERPASVVKEAVENSLDAGATEVRVSLYEGGKVRIVVEDNGEGIAFDELPLAAARHATSKIRTVEELERIRTLGFRGEALASISAVSRFEIRSRRGDDETGGLLRIEGGRQVMHTPVSCRKGTRISVEDLFYTLPARRKFLKSAVSEERRVLSLLRDFAVAYPSVAFSGSRDGKAGFSSSGDGDRERLLRDLWGDAGELRHCETAASHLNLECWWAPFPGKTRSLVTSFVNGRAVTDPLIRSAAGSLCRASAGNWVFLFSLDPELLDANIHPTKAEVRFRFPGEVFDTIQQAVLRLSGRVPSLPGAAVPSFSPFPERSFSPSPGAGTGRSGGWSFRDESSSPEGGNLFARVASELPSGPETAPKEAPAGAQEQGRHFRYFGQIASGYLVFETEEGIAVMDPHAAHERIGYERAGRLSAESVTVQKCALPLPVAPSLSVSVREHRVGLEAIGFAFGEQDGQLSLTAYPSLPGGMAEDPLRLLRSVLLEWTEDREAALGEILWKKLATIACGLSVKLGDRLTASEALALWRNLIECESPWNCPHGRPTVLSLTAKKLESYFGRE